MNEDLKILEAVERYISGGMNPDERMYFEGLRKSNPEIDQLVVEHTFFLQQLNRYDDTRNFRSRLNDVHIGLAEKGLINSTRLKGKAKVVYLFNKYKRVTAIAASIAGITTLAISALVWSVTPPKPAAEIEKLKMDMTAVKKKTEQQQKEINQVKKEINAPQIIYKTGGTGFLVDAKGLVVTNAHVIENARNIVVQNRQGKDFPVEVVLLDATRDLAILKIQDTAFQAPQSLPYSIRKTSPEIAEPVYTLGYPRKEIVYGEGYLSARTGYNGDTLTCQIAIAANPGNSGGPILNRNGEVVGVLSARQTSAEGVVFATQSKYILEALKQLPPDSIHKNRSSSTSNMKNLDRVQQVKKISDYVYMVKVN